MKTFVTHKPNSSPLFVEQKDVLDKLRKIFVQGACKGTYLWSSLGRTVHSPTYSAGVHGLCGLWWTQPRLNMEKLLAPLATIYIYLPNP